MLASNGDLLVKNIAKRDQSDTFKCKVRLTLTNDIVESSVARIALSGKTTMTIKRQS